MRIVSARQLFKMREEHDDFALIDVLETESFEREHLPGARNVPLRSPEDFAGRVESMVGGKHRAVVVYCASEECDASSRAAVALEEAGFRDVTDFEGGLSAWRAAGYELVSESDAEESDADSSFLGRRWRTARS